MGRGRDLAGTSNVDVDGVNEEGGVMEAARVKEVRRSNGVAKTVGIFALGAATGSIIALLCAPASGRVTRRRIALKVRAVKQQAIRQLGRTKKLLARKAEDLREATTERLVHARKWVAGQVANGNGRHPMRHRAVHHA